MKIRDIFLAEGEYGVAYRQAIPSIQQASSTKLICTTGAVELPSSLEEISWHLAVWSRIVAAALQLEKIQVAADAPPARTIAQQVAELAPQPQPPASPNAAPVDWRAAVNALPPDERRQWALVTLGTEPAQLVAGAHEHALDVLAQAMG